MPETKKHRYAINFDLSVKQSEIYYSATNPKGAYEKIRRYMSTHGFTHRQWSGYISDKPMSKAELIDFTVDLHRTFPWLLQCEGCMDATVITNIFDIKKMMTDTAEEIANETKI